MNDWPSGWMTAVEHFKTRFGNSPTHVAVAPGRVNLIGEHTDYQDGFAFPAAVDLYVFVAARLSPEHSTLVTDISSIEHVFDTHNLPPGRSHVWGEYAAGMAWAIQTRTGGTVPNIQAAVTSTLPTGSGLSSSAAMEMAFGTLWRSMADVTVSDPGLALLGQLAENEYVGMRCGILDQTASLFGKQDHALFLDTREPSKPEQVPLPGGIKIIVCDTKVKHEHTGSEYNDRRAQSESAAKALGVNALRDCDLAQVVASKNELGDVVFRRAKHIVTENERVQSFRHALVESNEKEIGRLMAASHESLRDDYEVSCPEMDDMTEAAQSAPGCIGARMMGGGFGGSCIALVKSGLSDQFVESASAEYSRKTGIDGVFRTCRAVDGARARSIDH